MHLEPHDYVNIDLHHQYGFSVAEYVPPRETSLSGDERGETSVARRLGRTLLAGPTFVRVTELGQSEKITAWATAVD